MIKLDKNSLVVVTGAAKGNGRAISEAIEESGAKVVRVDLLELEISEKNFVGQVTDKNFINKVVRFCSDQKYETLTLINNAQNSSKRLVKIGWLRKTLFVKTPAYWR